MMGSSYMLKKLAALAVVKNNLSPSVLPETLKKWTDESIKECCFAFCLNTAVENDHLDCLKRNHTNLGQFLDYYTVKDAVVQNKVRCVKFLIDNGGHFPDIMEIATEHGQLDFIKYLIGKNYTLPESTMYNVALRGDLDMLEYVHKNNAPVVNTEEFWPVTWAATFSGNVKCVKYVFENGYGWDTGREIYDIAIKKNNLSCVKYAHENGCGWDPKCSYHAAKKGYLDIIKYISQVGLTMHEDALYLMMVNGHKTCFEYVSSQTSLALRLDHSRVFKWALQNNNIDVFEHCFEKGGLFDPTLIAEAASRGCLEMVKHIHKFYYSVNFAKISRIAASKGHLNLIKYIRESNLDVHKKVAVLAARNGHLKVVKYIRQYMKFYRNRLLWNDELVKAAAISGGDLNTIDYVVSATL